MTNPFIHTETNQRDNNEDSVSVFTLIHPRETEPITILAIADGMGGHAYGELISQEALKKLSLTLFDEITFQPSLNQQETPLTTDTLIQLLTDTLKQTNKHIPRLIEKNHWGKGGTTLVVALIWQNKVIFGNLGDSPLFHYDSQSQQVSQQTTDHTVTAVLLKGGLITPELAPYHEGRNKLEFFAGCSHFPKDTPVYQLELADNDILLLCSDGISGTLSEQDITAIFQENNPKLEQIGEKLIQTAKDRGETDNQTLILWRYQALQDNVSNPVKSRRKRKKMKERELRRMRSRPKNYPKKSNLSLSSCPITEKKEKIEDE